MASEVKKKTPRRKTFKTTQEVITRFQSGRRLGNPHYQSPFAGRYPTRLVWMVSRTGVPNGQPEVKYYFGKPSLAALYLFDKCRKYRNLDEDEEDVAAFIAHVDRKNIIAGTMLSGFRNANHCIFRYNLTTQSASLAALYEPFTRPFRLGVGANGWEPRMFTWLFHNWSTAHYKGRVFYLPYNAITLERKRQYDEIVKVYAPSKSQAGVSSVAGQVGIAVPDHLR